MSVLCLRDGVPASRRRRGASRPPPRCLARLAVQSSHEVSGTAPRGIGERRGNPAESAQRERADAGAALDAHYVARMGRHEPRPRPASVSDDHRSARSGVFGSDGVLGAPVTVLTFVCPRT